MAEHPAKPAVADCAVGAAAADAWWRHAVVYENHLPSFRDGNGDGVGDLYGLTDALDYLAGTLGVTAVWVGPFFPSPMLDHGFDVTNYCDVDPVFGDLDAFDRLVAESHKHGVKIIVDYIPNHTSDRHPWFVESRASRHSEKRDWYVWADARPGEELPNNWTSEAGGSVWEWDEGSGQFYLHSHLREQPDLNWRNPHVHAVMLDVLRFWLDRGADGFRIDVAHMLMKDPELRDNPPNPDGAANPYDVQHPDFDTQLHVHDRMHSDVHGVLRAMREVVDGYPGDRVLIGEIGAMEWPEWASYFGVELDELQLPFAFRFIETVWNGGELSAAIADMLAAIPDTAWPILALGNHDRPRLASRLGLAQTRVAAMLLLTLPGTPCLFYGDELGIHDQPVPRERQRDYFGLSEHGVSRDPIRTPMPWNTARNGGFSDGPVDQLWLPVYTSYLDDNVATQLDDSASMLTLYRQLLDLRRSSAALQVGEWIPLAADDGLLVYQRRTATELKLIALNLTDTERRIPLTEGLVMVSTLPARGRHGVSGEIFLSGDEGVIIDLKPDRHAADADGRM